MSRVMVGLKNQGVSYFIVRWMGKNSGEAYVDDVEFRSHGKKPLFVNLSTGDKDSVEGRIDTQIGTLNVTLLGTDFVWEQIKFGGPKVTELISYNETSITVMMAGGYKVTISVTKGTPEVVYKISSNSTEELYRFPHPFTSKDGYAILPLNEGISFPINSYKKYGKQEFSFASNSECMAFW